MRGELDTSLDKLTTRERFLNDQFDRLMSQYKAVRTQLTGVQVRSNAWLSIDTCS
jgi:estrogen-related receptor beta like 1